VSNRSVARSLTELEVISQSSLDLRSDWTWDTQRTERCACCGTLGPNCRRCCATAHCVTSLRTAAASNSSAVGRSGPQHGHRLRRTTSRPPERERRPADCAAQAAGALAARCCPNKLSGGGGATGTSPRAGPRRAQQPRRRRDRRGLNVRAGRGAVNAAAAVDTG
jgi:hypothetical protein